MKNLLTLSMILLAISFAFADDADRSKTDAEAQAKLDKLHAGVQAICPVSGQKLGSHGQPVKVAIGKKKEHVFLCCEGCKSGKLDPEHWATIHKNIKKAQSTCPVMGKSLPKKSTFTIVSGRVVYVCCPPCIDKIEADDAKFLGKVDQSYAKHLAETSRPPVPAP